MLKHLGKSLLCFGAAFAPLAAAPARAQSDDNALNSAIDAFGERDGAEQIGLYDENQVRGFDLARAGSHRIDGYYFVRRGALADDVLEGVGVRLGVAAMRLESASPSGIVDYRLRRANPGAHSLTASTGTIYEYSPTLVLDGRYATGDGRVGLAGGVTLRPRVRYGDGERGQENSVGLVPEWRLSPHFRIRGVLALSDIQYATGYLAYFADGPDLRPPSARAPLLPPTYLNSRDTSYTAGLIAEDQLGPQWRAAAAAFFSHYDGFADFTAITLNSSDVAHATLYRTPGTIADGAALDLRLSRDFGPERRQRLTASTRLRQLQTRNGDTSVFDFGDIDISTPHFPTPPPFVDNGLRSNDATTQRSIGLDYTALLGDRAEIRAGMARAYYQKDYSPTSGAASSLEQKNWVGQASLLIRLTPAWSVYGSFVRGIEDSGIAPQYATNANQALPAVQADQSELGLRYSLGDRLNVILAGFDVSKPVAGVRSDGRYDFVGQVRHRGLELSVNGNLNDTTRVVFGLLAMQPRISGPLVDSGSVGDVPPGVSSIVASAGVNYTLARHPAWSLDAQFAYYSSRFADSANEIDVPARWRLNLGARYRFNWAHRPSSLRFVVTNVTNERAWTVGQTGAMYTIDPISARIALTTTFGG